MAFCKSCGAEVPEGTKFCQACGAPVEEPVVNNGATQNTSNSESNDKLMGVLAYIGILFIVPLLAAKDSKFARFHANQGLVLFITDVVLFIAAGIIDGFLPVIGGLINLAAYVVAIVLMILGIVNAANGEEKELPIIGQYRLIK